MPNISVTRGCDDSEAYKNSIDSAHFECHIYAVLLDNHGASARGGTRRKPGSCGRSGDGRGAWVGAFFDVVYRQKAPASRKTKFQY